MKTFEQLQKTASDWEAPDFGSYLRRNDVVRLGRSDALQDSIKASADGLMGILASYPEERSLDMITRLQVDTLLSGIFGKSLPEVEKNRNFYMQAVTGNNLDDKSFLTAFSNSFTSWNRQKDISRMQNRYDAMSDSPARDQLRTQIDDMLMKEAAQRDFTDRNWFSRNMVRSAPVFAQGMEGLMYALGGAAIGGLLAPAAVGSMPMLAQSVSSAGVALRAAGTVGGAGVGSVLGSAWNASHNLFETIRGATSLDMMNEVDSEGNPIPDDIRSFMATASAFTETALEYMINFPFLDRLFRGAQITPFELTRVSYANLAKEGFNKWSKSALGESGEEGVQQLSTGLFTEAAKILSNRLAGTAFEIGTEEIGKVLIDAGREFKDSLFPMGVMGVFGLGVDLAQPMLATSSMKSDANKHFKKDGQTIDARYVNTQGTKPDFSSSQRTDGKASEKLDPIEVVVHPLTGELRIPDAAQRQTVANLQAQGVSAIQGKVVKLDVVEGGDLSIVHSIALSTGAEVAGDDTVVFSDTDEMNNAASTFGKGAFDISRQDDGYVLTFQDSDGAFRKIQFIDSKTAETRNLDTVAADDSYFTETYVPYSGATMTADQYVSTHERKMIEDWLRKSVGRKVSRKNLRPGVESMLILSRATGISTDELIDRKIRLQFATENEVNQAIEKSGKDLSPENVNGWRSVKDSDGNTVYTIHLTKNANPSTIVHETGHILRALATDEQLRSFAEAYKNPMGGMWQSDIKARDGKFYLGDQVFNTEEEAKAVAEKNEERFAEDFVSYLQTGVAPNTEMQGLFARMKEFLKNVYNAFKDQLTPETRKAFDDLLNAGISQERNVENALFQTEDSVMSKVRQEYVDAESDLRANPDNFDADGNHLAPNGKPSNLAYEQWVQVRTPAFKKWFGDWEKNANFNWLMSADPLVALTGEEFKENLVDSVSAFYGQMGNRVTRDGLGEVTMTRHDVQSSVAHGIGRIKAAAFAAVPDVIQYGREFNQAENYKGRGYTSITIAAPISIREEQYICEVVINKRDKSNNFYLHEVEVKEKLQFGNQVRNYMDENHPNRNTKTGASRLIISKLLAEGKFESSKVVDANGEPMVVYHGTTNRDEVSTWNPKWKGYDTEYSRFSVFRRKNEGRANSGFFFNSDMDNAGGYGSEMYSCYLNLRNPLTIEANGQNYSSVKFGAMEKDTYDWARYAEKEGYDGVIFNNISDGVGFGDLSVPTNDYVAFKSNQIKSATGNRGTFDGGNPNILFQKAYHGSGRFFDRFDLNYIGTGEGNSLFGHGLYFSGSEEVARNYAELLGRFPENKQADIGYYRDLVRGRENEVREAKALMEDPAEIQRRRDEIRVTFDRIRTGEGQPQPFWAKLYPGRSLEEIEQSKLVDVEKRLRLAYENSVQRLEEAKGYLREVESLAAEGRNLYVVDIPDEGFLKWDKKVSSRLAERISKRLELDEYDHDELLAYHRNSGEELYRFLLSQLGDDRKVSDFLYSMGVKGVDYPAGTISGPQGKADGKTRNYVLFNAEDAAITDHILFQTATLRMDVPDGTDGGRYVYDLAYESQAEFENTVLDIASAVGLDADSVRFRKSLKGADRARTKVEQDYGGDWARLLDINGATMTFRTFEETEAAFDSLLRSHSDIIVRQKRKATDFGYRDFILNIRMSNGFVGELQLLEDSVFNAKKAGGHKIYNEARKLTEFYENREKYTAIFGSEVCTSIERLHDSLKAWSVEVYSSKGFVYDRPGLSAKASATLRESNELSSMLRPYMPRSLSVGFLSTTDFPSSEGTSTASRNTPPSSVLMGISQISKYLTAIENSYTHNIASDDGTVNSTPLFQLSDTKRQEYLDARKRDVKEAVENYFYVGDGILSEYAGEGWADDEIRFREHLRENPWILEAARKYQDLDEFLEQLQEDKEYDTAEYTWQEENDDWAERIWNYSRITTPEISDKQFLRQWTSSDRSLIGLAERLKGYSDIAFNAKGKQFITHKFGAFKGVSRKVLSITKDSTDAQIAEARTLIEENPRAYRKALQTVLQAEDRILEFRGLAARGEASRDSYYDALGETMEDELLQIDRLNEVAADKEDAKVVAEEQEEPRLTSSQKSLTGESIMRRLESAEAEVRELKKDVKSLSVAEDREKRAKEKYRALYKDYKKEANGLEALYSSTKDTLVAVLDENAGKSEEIRDLKKERHDLANALADRRRRVNDLRNQLTEARDELSKARKSVQAYKRLVEARRLSQARNVLLKKILRRAKFNPNTMDASFEDDFAFIPSLFDKNRSREDVLRWSHSMPEHLSENLSRYMGDNGWMFINRPINDWTIGELENLYESVKLMASDSRAMLQERKLAEQAWTQGKMVSYFKEQYGRAPDIEDMERFTKSILHDVNTTIQKYQGGEEGASKKALHGFTGSWMHIQRLARYLDGYDEGAMYQFFVRDLHAAFNEEYKNKNRRLENGKAVMKELGITAKKLNTPLYTFKTISGNEETLTVDQVMGVYVFAQNDGGASKLFSPAGNSIPWTEYENMVSKLDSQSRAWAHWMLAELGGDDNFNRLSAVDYRVNNHNMQREDSYFTFVARGKEVEGTADSFQGAKTVAKRKTDTGMMKSRTGAVYPLDLSVTGIWMREVGRQEHAIALTEWGKRANRLLGPNGVGHMISVNYGETTLGTLQSFVNNIIAGQDKLMWYERILNKLLSNASASVLSLNLATPIKQLASFSAVVRGDLDAIRFLQSISPFWGQTHDFKYAMERMRELAPDILNRTFNIEIARYRNVDSHTAAGRALHKINDWGLKGIEAMDGFVVNRLWAAKFLTEMDKHGNEQEAAFRASQFISETQSSSNMMDLSLMQQSSNPLLRMVAQFNNDAFQHWNMMFGDVPFYWKKRMYGKAIGSIASILLSSVFIIAVSGTLLRRKDDDDDEYWKRVRRAIAKTLIADTIPLVGGDISDGMGFGGGDLLQLSESFGGIVYDLLGDEEDLKKLSGDMWDVIEESGKVLGVPTVGPSRAIRAVKEQNLYYLFGGSWWRRLDR